MTPSDLPSELAGDERPESRRTVMRFLFPVTYPGGSTVHYLAMLFFGTTVVAGMGWLFEYLNRRGWEYRCTRRDVDIESLRKDLHNAAKQRNNATDRLAEVRRIITSYQPN